MASSSAIIVTNRSQAVRLPKPVAFPPDVHEVDILVVGNSRLIVAKGRRWDVYFERGPFMRERVTPPNCSGPLRRYCGQRQLLTPAPVGASP